MLVQLFISFYYVCLYYFILVLESSTPTQSYKLGRVVRGEATLDLWTDPAGVTALLARWSEKLSGGIQAGRSVKGVGSGMMNAVGIFEKKLTEIVELSTMSDCKC